MCRTSTGGHASHICCRITCTGATRWVLEELSANPLDRVKWKPPKMAEVVDRRVVVNPRQACELLTAVTYVGQQRRGPYARGQRLMALYACMYFADTTTRRGSRAATARLLPARHW